MKTEVKRKIDK